MVKKELQMECNILFQENPLLALSIKEIGRKLGRKEDELQPVLALLVKQGIIEQSGDAANASYQYQEPATIIEFKGNGPLEKL